MPNPMDVARVAANTVERTTGLNLVELAGPANRILSGAGRSSEWAENTLNFAAARDQLASFGINLFKKDEKTGITNLASELSLRVTTKGDGKFAIYPMRDGDTIPFSAGWLGQGRATQINTFGDGLITMQNPLGVMAKPGFMPNSDAARWVEMYKMKGSQHIGSYDEAGNKSGIWRGLYGMEDPVLRRWAQFPNKYASTPDAIGTVYDTYRLGRFGNASNPIHTDVSHMTRYRNGQTDVWLHKPGFRGEDTPLRYDAMNRLIRS